MSFDFYESDVVFKVNIVGFCAAHAGGCFDYEQAVRIFVYGHHQQHIPTDERPDFEKRNSATHVEDMNRMRLILPTST